ncbi:hypothetical protein GCM10007304_00940 [Rhodococcoides trifolii]|uniref:Lipoprotein n=2 Tax=Rhodococcoides trifolii TaxID=908250 RepID=A0A917CKJ2_9NOCA|nr:hypothetical protein GCM10007304_00940 [Rhodococcus trifolii]
MWRVTLTTLLALGSLTACSPIVGRPTSVQDIEVSVTDAVRSVTVTSSFEGNSQTLTATTAHGTPLGQVYGITVPRVFEVYGIWSGTADGTGDVSSGLTQVGVLEPARSAATGTSTTFASSTASGFLYFYVVPRYRPDDRTTLGFQLSLAGSG